MRTRVIPALVASSLLAGSLAVLAGSSPVSAAEMTFNGSNTGSIADGSGPIPTFGTPLDVTFDASAFSGSISNVSVSITMAHTWVADLDVVLIAPDATEHVIFSRVGAATETNLGDSSDLDGTYTFADTAGGDLWATAALAGGSDVIADGDYRTSTGPPGGGVATSIDSAFAGVGAAGTWTLRFRDAAGGDTGSVTSATLTLTTSTPPPIVEPNFDFDGDGVDDAAVARADGATIQWWVQGSSSPVPPLDFGATATDLIVPADYDGDGTTDRAVWRPDAQATFYIFESSTQTTRTVPFGITGDNPLQVGDWDGDGKADPAVWRQSTGTFYYLGSDNNPGGDITFIPFGTAGDTPVAADYDGDGKMDPAIYRDIGSGQAQFWILRSSDFGVEIRTFGLMTDNFVRGDYDGDGKADIMAVRTDGSQRTWYLLRSSDFGVEFIPFGSNTDSLVVGDHDGDGKSDVAIWRASTGQWWIRSSDTLGVFILNFGGGGSIDIPVGGAYVT